MYCLANIAILHLSISCYFCFKVEVKVTDRNDNGPEFPNHGDFSTVIRRESSPGTYVYRFSAKDKDLGENGQVSYILAEQFKG